MMRRKSSRLHPSANKENETIHHESAGKGQHPASSPDKPSSKVPRILSSSQASSSHSLSSPLSAAGPSSSKANESFPSSSRTTRFVPPLRVSLLQNQNIASSSGQRPSQTLFPASKHLAEPKATSSKTCETIQASHVITEVNRGAGTSARESQQDQSVIQLLTVNTASTTTGLNPTTSSTDAERREPQVQRRSKHLSNYENHTSSATPTEGSLVQHHSGAEDNDTSRSGRKIVRMFDSTSESDSSAETEEEAGDIESGKVAEGDLEEEVEADDEEENNQGRKRFKRRIRQPISKPREQRKTARNRGEEYVNAKGIFVPEKTAKPLPKCKKDCASKISPEICEELCSNLWQGLADQNRRASYIASLVEVKPKSTQRINSNVSPDKRKNRSFSNLYHVSVYGENVNVCKGCFQKIFNVSSKFIDLAVKKKMSTTGGIVANDERGRASNPLEAERREAVRNFLDKIPKYKSHYARNRTESEYLPSHLNLKIIYDQYCLELSELGNPPVSRWSFEREFYEMGLKIKERKIDTCAKCDKLDAAVTFSCNAEERQRNQELLDQHHQMWEAARDQKRKDIEKALNDKKIATAAFDLQQCLPTPYLETSIVFYKRQLWTYNLTIHDCASKRSTHNMWHEGEGSRGPNQIGSSLYHYIMGLPADISELIVWSDTCGGQNKNSIVAAALATALLHKPTLKKIEQKFLVPGHTHMECDTDHSTIEGAKKRAIAVHLPRDWMNLVRNASRMFTVTHLKTNLQFDFKDLLKGRQSPLVRRKKNVAGNTFVWKDVVWMRHDKGHPGLIAYKTSHDEELPFSFLDVRRKRSVPVMLNPASFSDPLPISHKKKSDLISLLDLIDPECAPFYWNLKSDKDTEDFHPDLLPTSDEEESGSED